MVYLHPRYLYESEHDRMIRASRVSPKRRVKRGIAFLDKNRPGWRRKIKKTLLNMNDRGLCILGQLFGDYEDGKTKMGLSLLRSIQRGFTDIDGYREEELTKVWLQEMKNG